MQTEEKVSITERSKTITNRRVVTFCDVNWLIYFTFRNNKYEFQTRGAIADSLDESKEQCYKRSSSDNY